MYGFCPVCYATGISRERRINGNDTCKNGHKYPSKDSLNSKPSTTSIQCPSCGCYCSVKVESEHVDKNTIE